MKYSVLILLFCVAFAQTNLDVINDEIEDFFRCLKGAEPLIRDIEALRKAKAENDTDAFIMYLYKTIRDGDKEIKDCLKLVPELEKKIVDFLPFKWSDLIKCVLSTEPVVKDIRELGKAIEEKRFIEAGKIIARLLKDGSTTKTECHDLFHPQPKPPKPSSNDEIDDLFRCIKEAEPLVRDIADMKKAKEVKNWELFISLAYKTIRDGDKEIRDCMKLFPELEKKIIEVLPFKWGDLVKCLLSTENAVGYAYQMYKKFVEKDTLTALEYLIKVLREKKNIEVGCEDLFKPKPPEPSFLGF